MVQDADGVSFRLGGVFHADCLEVLAAPLVLKDTDRVLSPKSDVIHPNHPAYGFP
jgi:hypothetical protein